MQISEEFSLALTEDRYEEESFKPLLEKFEELKEVIHNNFKYSIESRNWYFVKKVISSNFEISIVEKIYHETGKHLLIRINGNDYVIGMYDNSHRFSGRLYFIPKTMIMDKDKTLIHITSHMFGENLYYLDNRITNVQFFVHMIKKYRNYLVRK